MRMFKTMLLVTYVLPVAVSEVLLEVGLAGGGGNGGDGEGGEQES